MIRPDVTADTLRWVLDHDFALPEGVDPHEFASAMRGNLRSPDPELRDRLTYSVLAGLLTRNLLTDQQMAEWLSWATTELRRGIGESGTDSVFGRSFAVLIAAAILFVDTERPVLPVSDVHNTIERVIEYAFAEQDHRGYVERKGWAHSVAHTADALGACALHPHATRDHHLGILDAIHHLATVPAPLAFEEDDRLAYPVLRMIMSDVEQRIGWREWILKFEARHSPDAEETLRVGNAGHFLRSLYLLLVWELPECNFLTELEQHIKRLNVLYHYGTLPGEQR